MTGCWCWCCVQKNRVLITGNQLCKGVSGVIYPAKLLGRSDIPSEKELAVKISNQGVEQLTETEGEIIEKLQGNIGIPQLFFRGAVPKILFSSDPPSDFGKVRQRQVLVTEGFATDLLRWIGNVEVKELTVRQICYQLLNILEGVHKCGILHLDVKPENVMFRQMFSPEEISYKSPSKDQDIYLIGFGLAVDLNHKKATKRLGKSKWKDFRIRGHPSFRSRSQHWGEPLGRKDDLETIVNMAMSLLGQAPWAGLAAKLALLVENGTTEGGREYQEILDQIGSAKHIFFTEPPGTLPRWLSDWIRHINGLRVDYAPENYNYERSLLQGAAGPVKQDKQEGMSEDNQRADVTANIISTQPQTLLEVTNIEPQWPSSHAKRLYETIKVAEIESIQKQCRLRGLRVGSRMLQSLLCSLSEADK